MKKQVIALIAIVSALTLLMPGNLRAEVQNAFLYTNIGYSFSEYKGLVVDVGLDVMFSERFGGEIAIEYYLDPLSDLEKTFDADYKIIDMGLLGLYNIVTSEKFELFAKAGVHFTTIKAKKDIGGISAGVSTSDFGVGGGLGMRYGLSEKLKLNFGLDYKVLFSDETITWFKVSVGIAYSLKQNREY